MKFNPNQTEIRAKCNCENCNCQVDVNNPLRQGICLMCEGGKHINTKKRKEVPKITKTRVF